MLDIRTGTERRVLSAMLKERRLWRGQRSPVTFLFQHAAQLTVKAAIYSVQERETAAQGEFHVLRTQPTMPAFTLLSSASTFMAR